MNDAARLKAIAHLVTVAEMVSDVERLRDVLSLIRGIATSSSSSSRSSDVAPRPQLDLFGAAPNVPRACPEEPRDCPETAPSALSTSPEHNPHAPECPDNGTSGIYAAATVAPSSSSSSDLQDHRREKKTGHRPHTDEEIPADFVETYNAVVAERGVSLPSATYLWSKFVEFLWAKEVSFARRYGLKRRWRQWVEHEAPKKDAAEENAPTPEPRREIPPPPPVVERPRPAVEHVDPELAAVFTMGAANIAARIERTSDPPGDAQAVA